MNSKALFFVSLFSLQSIDAAILIRGNNTTSPFGFTQPVTAFAFDPLSGTSYVGLGNTDDSNTDEYAVCALERPALDGPLRFTPFATDELITNKAITLLAVSSGTNTRPVVLSVNVSDPALLTGISHQVTHKTVDDTRISCRITAQSDNLADATGQTATEIIALTADDSCAFAAVTGTDNFGIAGSESGIAVVSLERTSNNFTLTPLDATTGMPGNQAIALDATNPVLTGGTSDVIFLGNIDADRVILQYDATLDLIYGGLRLQTGNEVDDCAKAVFIGQKSESNMLTLKEIVPNSAVDTETGIVAARADTINTPIPLSIQHLGVMHTTAGPDYLIVVGGEGDTVTNGNKLYALPLVNNPTSITHGMIADKTSALDTDRHVFTTAATTPNGLPLITEQATLIGLGDAPIAADIGIEHLYIAGDTVYISTSLQDFASGGIFYSRAQFGTDGKIIRWTPWTKKAVPVNGFPGIALQDDTQHTGAIAQFAVDARTGSVTFVEADTKKHVGITSWNTSNGQNGLLTTLNDALSDGCYSVLDLDQSTRGFAEQNSTIYRYALFGGTNKVACALISQTLETNEDTNEIQTVTTDFLDKSNFLITELPEDAGCVQCLEYARQTQAQGTQNYFFAGTDTGLFVFANPEQTGVSVDTLSTLDQSPFSTGVWHKVSSITGSVVQLKTTGKKLYILEQSRNSLQTKLISVPFDSTITEMFASPVTLAQTQVAPFQSTMQFTDIAVFDAAPDPEPFLEDQLLLATTRGLFYSNRTNGVQDATSATDANWTVVADSDQQFFTGIGQDMIEQYHAAWPCSLQDNHNTRTFTHSRIHQITGHANGSFATALVPEDFTTAQSDTVTNSLDRITTFWSDGARRFFVMQRLQSHQPQQTTLNLLPYHAQRWNMTQPIPLLYETLQTAGALYWVRTIGASGLLIVGTQNGVIGLS